MKEGIISKSKYMICAEVDSPCPIDWLSEYYEKYQGKVIEIDDTLLSFILTNADFVRKVKTSDRQSNVYALWHAGVGSTGESYPETRVKIEIHGNYNVGDNSNRNFITRIAAEDVKNFGFSRTVENASEEEIVFLKAKIQKDFLTPLDSNFDVTLNGRKLKK